MSPKPHHLNKVISGLSYLAGPVALLWQRAAVKRAQFSAAYEAIDNHRTEIGAEPDQVLL